MAGHANAAPAFIKRKKLIVQDGHHGGAWKIAYADFVTAMMAFFMLMWLIGATTEKQRKGLADYFNPTVVQNQTVSGGDGLFGGESALKDKTLAQTGMGAFSGFAEKSDPAAGETASDQAALDAALQRLNSELQGKGGESQTMERLLSHVVTKVTDEGLVIDVFDTPQNALFDQDTAVPTETLTQIAALLADVLANTTNSIAVAGYVRFYPVVLIKNPRWDLSAARAQQMRQLLEGFGMKPGRTARISGHADRKPVTANPMAARNNRVEVILLRQDR